MCVVVVCGIPPRCEASTSSMPRRPDGRIYVDCAALVASAAASPLQIFSRCRKGARESPAFCCRPLPVTRAAEVTFIEPGKHHITQHQDF